MITSSALVESSLMARYTIWRSAGCRVVSDVFCEISRTYILVLEELCCSKEQVRSLVCLELFATVEEEHDAGEEGPTFPGVNRRFVKDAGVLEDRRFAVRIQLVVLFARHRAYR